MIADATERTETTDKPLIYNFILGKSKASDSKN
jgi:hypothetical protein